MIEEILDKIWNTTILFDERFIIWWFFKSIQFACSAKLQYYGCLGFEELTCFKELTKLTTFARLHCGALLHWGLRQSDNISEENVNADLCQSFSDLAAIIFLLPPTALEMEACCCNGSSLHTVTLQLQIRTNQKDRN